MTAEPLNLGQEVTFILFETHWNVALKLIHLYSDIPKGKANSAEDVTHLVETKVASALAVHASIADTFNDVISTEQMTISRAVRN